VTPIACRSEKIVSLKTLAAFIASFVVYPPAKKHQLRMERDPLPTLAAWKAVKILFFLIILRVLEFSRVSRPFDDERLFDCLSTIQPQIIVLSVVFVGKRRIYEAMF